jgi:capsid protein
MAILNGSLSFPDYESNPDRYTKVRWRPRGWSWVDPWKETQASIEAINAGLSTLTQELSKQGLDIQEVLTERASELELAKSLGLNLLSNPVQETPDLTNLSDSTKFSELIAGLTDQFNEENLDD